MDAAPGAVEFHAVIAAADATLDTHAHRQRHEAMRTPIDQCGDPLVGLTKQHHRFAQETAAHGLGADVAAPCGDIPVITREFRHGSLFTSDGPRMPGTL